MHTQMEEMMNWFDILHLHMEKILTQAWTCCMYTCRNRGT